MGNIEIVGIINENFSFGEVNVPTNANTLEFSIDNMNPINQILICIPVLILILIPFIIKQRKYGLLNKDYRNKMQKELIGKNNLNTIGKQVRFVLIRIFGMMIIMNIVLWVIVLPIHELIHAIPGALQGANMKIGFIPQMLTFIAITSTPLSKLQYLIMLIMPAIVLGIIPAIIIIINFPKKIKNAVKAWIAMMICVMAIMTTGADIISTYNIITNVPDGAIIQQTDDNIYWYIPEAVSQ